MVSTFVEAVSRSSRALNSWNRLRCALSMYAVHLLVSVTCVVTLARTLRMRLSSTAVEPSRFVALRTS